MTIGYMTIGSSLIFIEPQLAQQLGYHIPLNKPPDATSDLFGQSVTWLTGTLVGEGNQLTQTLPDLIVYEIDRRVLTVKNR